MPKKKLTLVLVDSYKGRNTMFHIKHFIKEVIWVSLHFGLWAIHPMNLLWQEDSLFAWIYVKGTMRSRLRSGLAEWDHQILNELTGLISSGLSENIILSSIDIYQFEFQQGLSILVAKHLDLIPDIGHHQQTWTIFFLLNGLGQVLINLYLCFLATRHINLLDYSGLGGQKASFNIIFN